MNLTLLEVKERIEWLLENTTVTPSARTNVADIDLVNGVGREAHFVVANSEGQTLGDLEAKVESLREELSARKDA